MAKIKNNYFELIEKQVSYCVEAATLLAEIMSNFDTVNIDEQRAKMHIIEHNGDELHHDILNRLSREFITPIDQEDILGLVQIIDEITDAIDEVVLEFYMYHIEKLPSDAAALAKIMAKCVSALYNAAGEMHNFKKPEKLRQLLVEVNTIESEADGAFVEAVHNLFGADISAKELIGGKAIYESLENCCDQCEHAADVIERIIIKNT